MLFLVPGLDSNIAYRVHEITKPLEEFKTVEILEPSKSNEQVIKGTS
jgi:hypothetical protein